jgi:asparagine synthase (glutamine-hydrolysing)
MCGICGFTGEVIDRDKVIKNMTDVITHRGPDSDGVFMDDHIAMGFRRLSIIDLDAGHQPIYNEDKTLVLTFNGEIYNYRELRKVLIEKGHKFYTDTDSEVLIHGFEECSALLFIIQRISPFLLPVTSLVLSRCTTQ